MRICRYRPHVCTGSRGVPCRFRPFGLRLFLPCPICLNLTWRLFICLRLIGLSSNGQILYRPLINGNGICRFLGAFRMPSGNVLYTVLLHLWMWVRFTCRFPICLARWRVVCLMVPFGWFRRMFGTVIMASCNSINVIYPSWLPTIIVVFLRCVVRYLRDFILSLVTIRCNAYKSGLSLRFRILMGLVRFRARNIGMVIGFCKISIFTYQFLFFLQPG